MSSSPLPTVTASGSVAVKVKKELTDEEKKAADEKAAAEKAGSKTKRVFIKAGILLAMIAIIVLITLFSGYIAKLMMKASSCNETKILLVTAGVLTSVIFMGLGYLLANNTYNGIMSSMKGGDPGFVISTLGHLTAEEQYRYRYYRR